MSSTQKVRLQPLQNLWKLKHPIVLVHGLGAKGAYGPFDYFHSLPGILRKAGNRLLIADLTAWQSIDRRAEQLKKQIEAAFPDQKVNLIGHSMGGLDARYLASALGFHERIASITTLGTPNRGSAIGDLALGRVPSKALVAVESMLATMGYSAEGFRQITQQHYREVWAEKMADAPGVTYFSATSAIPKQFMRHSLPVFWLPHRVLMGLEGDNDGFVSVESSKWGEHIATYSGDHYGQIGQFLGRSRGLDFLALYEEIFARLHREAF